MSIRDYFVLALAITLFIYLMYKWACALDPDKDFPLAKAVQIRMTSEGKFVLKCKVLVSRHNGWYLEQAHQDELLFTQDPSKALQMSQYLAEKWLKTTGHHDTMEAIPCP